MRDLFHSWISFILQYYNMIYICGECYVSSSVTHGYDLNLMTMCQSTIKYIFNAPIFSDQCLIYHADTSHGTFMSLILVNITLKEVPTF